MKMYFVNVSVINLYPNFLVLLQIGYSMASSYGNNVGWRNCSLGILTHRKMQTGLATIVVYR